jgi:hypothetical protein
MPAAEQNDSQALPNTTTEEEVVIPASPPYQSQHVVNANTASSNENDLGNRKAYSPLTPETWSS